ncbi:GAP family protein [Prescottella sp. R16]|uniref:GAP family protein n=1 Tax=Prescottella sp. R16 TaxID=3064529 RepID=UPI00272E651E|nr:GAP family protein [Prescottella sp. R16]
MTIDVNAVLLASLVGLALVDSTSIGTLVLPVWMLLAPGRPPVGRIVRYLVAIAGFYLLVGMALLTAARIGLDVGGRMLDSSAAKAVQLAVGAALFALSFRFDSKKRRDRGESSRVVRWRDRALSAGGSGGVTTLALSVGTLELITMVPYLAAIALIVSVGAPAALSIPLLAAYCVVMILPAVALLGLRMLVGQHADGILHNLDEFFTRNADSAVGWAMGIAGFLLAMDAANVLLAL